MTPNIKRRALILTALFIIAAGLSAVTVGIQERQSVDRVLFFPTDFSQDERGEVRALPRRGGAEENLELYVREILLGPVTVHYLRLFPADTRLLSIMEREDVVYINLSREALFGGDGVPLNLESAVEILQSSIHFNFPSVKEIIVAVDGEVPETGLKSAAERKKK